MALALALGLLYLVLVPPWQHYDEPTHFEYAWLIARYGDLPERGDEDQAFRREVAASMAVHGFFRGVPQPYLLTNDEVWLGVSELGHPPVYYILVSLPLRLVLHLDVTSQLYVARSISLLLYLLTVAIAAGIVRELTAPGHALRWAAPLTVAFIPTFTDVMSGVNSDAGAVVVFSLFLWGATRAIAHGLTWRRGAWIVGTALLAVVTKNTASPAIVLAPLACVIAVWVQQDWRWRWLLAGLLAAGTLGAIVLFSWGDPALWYRWAYGPQQDAATRTTWPEPPLGEQVFVLEAGPEAPERRLSTPLATGTVEQIAGETVTVGGWIWADRPITSRSLGLLVSTVRNHGLTLMSQPISITSEPQFVALTFDVPANAQVVHYALVANAYGAADRQVRLYLDGAVLVEGDHTAADPPVFTDSTGQQVRWSGQQFDNLVRNPSAEAGWPRLRPWLEHALYNYIHRSPSQLVVSLIDLGRLREIFLTYLLLPATDSMIAWYCWSQVRLASPIWLYLGRAAAIVAAIGCVAWFMRARSSRPKRTALAFLGGAALLLWANTILRPLPLLGEEYVVPIARYSFPAIVATGLAFAGGWWAIWPRGLRRWAAALLLAGLLALNAAALTTIVAFFGT